MAIVTGSIISIIFLSPVRAFNQRLSSTENNNNIVADDSELTWIAGSVVLSESPPQQLKFWRKKFGIKQADLARKMSLTPSVLSDYEKGRRPSPGARFIKRYLLALDELAKSNGKSIEQIAPSPVATVHINQP